MKTNKSLKGYRIGVWKQVQDWELAGAEILFICSNAPTLSYEKFQAWWENEVQRATNDKVTLVVVESKKIRSRRYDWLKRKEEEEWDGLCSGNGRVIFTTYGNIYQATAAGASSSLRDTWGDCIEKPPQIEKRIG
mmetsp:Transcript_8757/g.15921  ORF Transcript_8757/g.15921 Transcript_8757/m.15921 type:complete len:135 (-) Transcript_8757:203-607(-)